MNVFYAGALLTLVLSVTMLRIDSSSISAYRASVRPIRLQQIFLPTWLRVGSQVVEQSTSTFPVCSDVKVISTLQLTLVRAASTLGHSLRVGEEWKMAAHAESCYAVGILFVPLVV